MRRLLSEVHPHASAVALSHLLIEQKGTYLCLVDSLSSGKQLYKQIDYFISVIPTSSHSQSPKPQVFLFQDRETLPYDTVSAPSELISQRLQVLEQWQNCQWGICIVAVSSAMHYLPSRRFVNRSQLHIKKGQRYGFNTFINYLISAGYERVPQVTEAGQYSQRGGVIDVFTANVECTMPLRIEFFDDDIEEIRYFDVHSQRSVKALTEVNLSVANELTLDKTSQDYFLSQFLKHFIGADNHPSYQAVLAGNRFNGIEYFLPLFHPHGLETIADYCPPGTHCITMPRTKKVAKDFYRECQRLYRSIQQEGKNLALPVDMVFANIETITNSFDSIIGLQNPLSRTHNASVEGFVQLPSVVTENGDLQSKINDLLHYARQHNFHLVLSFNSALRRDMLESYLSSIALSWQSTIVPVLTAKKDPDNEILITIVQTPLTAGFIDKKRKAIFCTEGDIYGKVIEQKELSHDRGSTTTVQNPLDRFDLPSLQIGQLVTHIEHGIGLFKGLKVMEVGGFKHDVVAIEYANGGVLYVPVDRLHYIERYIGNSDLITLDHLGSQAWQNRKEKAKKRIYDVAAELLDIYAKRDQTQRPSTPLTEDYHRFVAEFPYVETPDQQQASAEVIHDLQQTKPMDRLICGDVGFGKTEIAMRAAYAVVASGKQVAILVPTTLLANQHYQSFGERFANWAVRIATLSRLSSGKENQQILTQLADGTIDIVIGTHRLLQKDVSYHNLGLVVIDEEHRFGVRQKESFKKIRTEVDLMSMTATPIPRTLNMAFSHLRDVSLIAEAPAGRLSVHTFVSEYSDNIIKEAILREIRRDGQVYFLHNNISSITRRAQEIATLLPEVTIGVAHGQMPKKAIEMVMEGFYVGHYQILLCTTIIEMGLDVPNANTIIIDRADKFGLAQLHQLRGRVGRSSHQAYAYLFTPDMTILKAYTKKRLLAIQETQQLGAGFRLALEDMEIRGVGEILGEQQQGHAQKIGLNLYLDMLDEALKPQYSKSGQTTDRQKKPLTNCEVDFNVETIFPEQYIDDVNTRLSFYQRISLCNRQQLDDLWMEIRDRFGPPPLAVEHLFDAHRARLYCTELGITECKVHSKNIKLKLTDDNHLSVEKIVHHLQQHPTQWQLKNNHELLIDKSMLLKETEEMTFSHLKSLLDNLISPS